MPRSRRIRRIRGGYFGEEFVNKLSGQTTPSTDPNAPSGESSWFSKLNPFGKKDEEPPASTTNQPYVDPNMQPPGQSYGGYRFRSRRFRGGRYGPKGEPKPGLPEVYYYRKSRRRR